MSPERVKRPLKENPNMFWDGCLIETKNPKKRIDTYGYQWIVSERGLFNRGDLTIIFSEGLFITHLNGSVIHRGSMLYAPKESSHKEFTDQDKLMEDLREKGWGKPPHFDLICQSIPTIKAIKEQGGSKEDIRIALRSAALKWEKAGVKLIP